MLVSVVIISRNEAPRLRLVLESFAGQHLSSSVRPLELEVVVVDDGSVDETGDVLREVLDEKRILLRVVRNLHNRGRSLSRNIGVAAASGEVIVLFDGDCLAAPNLIARHAEAHAERAAVMGRGETFHVRCTRFFRDPETGAPLPGEEARVKRMGEQLRDAIISRQQVRNNFDAVATRGEPGIYAGAGPRRLYELEMQALHAIPNAGILWMTAPGQNFSIRRADFLAVGGFDPRLTLNEHRELALRLYQRGVRIVPVDGARSFHMLHRVGWRDPSDDVEWERTFYAAHPYPATKLMNIFWLSLSRDKDIPQEARIESLEQLDDVVNNGSRFDYDSLRNRHPKLAPLPVTPPPSER